MYTFELNSFLSQLNLISRWENWNLWLHQPADFCGINFEFRSRKKAGMTTPPEAARAEGKVMILDFPIILH